MGLSFWVSNSWLIWALIGFILLIVEMFTPTLFLVGMGIGAILAALANYYGASFVWQGIIFAVFSLIFTVFIRPMFKDSLFKHQKNDTNMYIYDGQQAKVIVKIDNEEDTGRIRIFDEEWPAKSVDGSIFEVGDIVIIKEIKSMTAYVEAQKKD